MWNFQLYTIIGQHFIVSYGTTRLQRFARIRPKVDTACADRSAVQPGVRVNDVHHNGVRCTDMTRAWVEWRECRIQSRDSRLKIKPPLELQRVKNACIDFYLGRIYSFLLLEIILRPTMPESCPPSECPTK